jgi:hypothetical protein
LVGGVTATGIGLLLAVTAPAAGPTLSLQATDAVIGQKIHAIAELTESPGASGEISFEVFGPGDLTCSGPALTPPPASASVSGEGEYSSNFTPPTAGDYYWSAHYSGDLENEPADAECSAISTVDKASPGLEGSASSGAVGTAIHDEVTVTGGFSPTGEVTFSVYGPADTSCSTPLETSSAPLQSGNATSADFIPQQTGEFRWTVEYEGDANNEPAGLACGAENQASAVAKASPTLAGLATSAEVGQTITDSATLSGGFAAGGQLLFRAYGPGDQSCAGAAKYEEAVAVSGDDTYSPAGFSPPAGLYRWTVEYEGDANNEPAGLACGAENQASAVGKVDVTLAVSATGGTVGGPVNATATIKEGAIPAGQLTFKAFFPGDASCSRTAAFSSTVGVAGNGPYRSATFLPSRVGTFRWTVGYSGDANHDPTTAGCGSATSSISQAVPSITGQVRKRLRVGTSIRDTATLQGGYAPTGTITFRIYGPVARGCGKPVLVNTVAIAGNSTVQSDPLVPRRPGRYSFVASYSGDAANQAAAEACDSVGQAVLVQKRRPKVKPRALLVGDKRVSIRAQLSGAASPSGVISFRLYGPGDRHCRRKPAFSGGTTVKKNGNYPLAGYIATKSGVYRLTVSYSGDQRNMRYEGSCSRAQLIRVG